MRLADTSPQEADRCCICFRIEGDEAAGFLRDLLPGVLALAASCHLVGLPLSLRWSMH